MKRWTVSRCVLFLLILGSWMIGMKAAKQVDEVICDSIYVLSFEREDKYFTDHTIADMEEEGVCLTYSYELYPEISNGLCEQDARIIATNENYAFFTNMDMCSGAFFNRKQIERELPIAVLSRKAAYNFFGNENCIGEKIYLDKAVYEVIGVAKTQNTEEAVIWIPDSTTKVLNATEKQYQQIWCIFENMAETSLAISKAGFSISELDITQLDLYKNVFWLRCCIPLILVEIEVTIRFFKKIISLLKKIDDDSKRNTKWWCTLLLYGGLCGETAILTIGTFQTGWCVPPYYQLAGERGWNLWSSVLRFYTLSGTNIGHVESLNQCNVLSLFSFVICLLGIVGISSQIEVCKTKN